MTNQNITTTGSSASVCTTGITIEDLGEFRLNSDEVERIKSTSHLGDRFWPQQFEALRNSLAGKGQDFIMTATLEQIRAVAGQEFMSQSEPAQQAIFALMRQERSFN
jgi:hypothetical protein